MISWSLIWIALGGAFGAVARYIVGLFVGFPFGTLTVNIFGSFLIVLILSLIIKDWIVGNHFC